MILMLACPPKSKEDLLAIGIMHLEVTAEHTIGHCQECNHEVWLGKQQQELNKALPDLTEIFCFACALKKGAERNAELVRMGKGGAKYITTKGKIHADGKD